MVTLTATVKGYCRGEAGEPPMMRGAMFIPDAIATVGCTWRPLALQGDCGGGWVDVFEDDNKTTLWAGGKLGCIPPKYGARGYSIMGSAWCSLEDISKKNLSDHNSNTQSDAPYLLVPGISPRCAGVQPHRRARTQPSSSSTKPPGLCHFKTRYHTQ